MRVQIVALVFPLLAAAVPAMAADAVAYGPAPSWLKPVMLPNDDGTQADAPAKVLMRSYQLRFTAGGMETYIESYVRVQTPQGLQGLGNIALPWKPDTDLLTVHHCELLREGKVIDLIASGEKFEVLRRENNLEYAALDGVLTAVLQPHGMQVGDVLRLAFTVKRESTLLPLPETALAEFSAGPLANLEVRASWDRGTPMRWQASQDVKGVREARNGKEVEVTWSAQNLEPIAQPDNVPSRYWRYPLLQFTSYSSWNEISRVLAPLYARASALSADSPLKAEARAIAAASADDDARVEAVLKLVQDRVRYVFLGMGDGNLNPASADLTWQRRFGDCKGKSALLIALLRELGIDAEPVAVATNGGDALATRMPMVGAFDHVIVRAHSGKRTWWLDGAGSGSWRREDLRTPNYFWGLPMTARGDPLLPMLAEPARQPLAETSTTIDAREGLHTDAPFTAETRFRGATGAALHAQLLQLGQAQREQGLRNYWKQEYDFVDVKNVQLEFDDATGTLVLRMQGTANMYWGSYQYTTDGMRVGFSADYTREPGINVDAPFVIEHPLYKITRQTIQLPDVGNYTTTGADYDLKLAGIHYMRRSRIENRVFTGEVQVKTLVPEIAAKEAGDAEARLNDMWKDRLDIKATNYKATDADIAALRKRTYTDRANLVWRGNMLLDRGDYDAAFADFDAAVKAEPKSSVALAHRGLASYWKWDLSAATTDLDAALALDANNAVAMRGLGLVRRERGDNEGAVEKFSASLRLDPENTFALSHRAYAYSSLGKQELALADAAEAIRLRPQQTDMYDLRARMFASMGERTRALDEMNAMYAANPGDVGVEWYGAQLLAWLGMHDVAVEAMDRLIASRPSPANYLTRSDVRHPDDFAARLADMDEAAKLDPKVPDLPVRRARVLSESGDHRAAADILSAQIKLLSDPVSLRYLRMQRAVELLKLGDTVAARKDMAAALKDVTDGGTLNNFCWTFATAGEEAAAALAACDKALAIAPKSAAYLDSRGFALLQLQRWDEAIAAYDAALSLRPRVSTSLYGRGIGKQRRCRCTDGDADLAAAESLNPGVARLFKLAGLPR